LSTHESRIKEVAGAVTGNDTFCSEGNADQAIGKVKQAGKRVRE
jgi:uncharacterized protein YjbJ (UPF0337 family)